MKTGGTGLAIEIHTRKHTYMQNKTNTYTKYRCRHRAVSSNWVEEDWLPPWNCLPVAAPVVGVVGWIFSIELHMRWKRVVAVNSIAVVVVVAVVIAEVTSKRLKCKQVF